MTRLAVGRAGPLLRLVVGVVLAAACGPAASSAIPATSPVPGSATAGAGGGPTDAALPPRDPIEGVVIHVESTGLDSVTGFTLRAVDGQTYDFVLGRLQNASQFPPGHLAEHAASSEPILVTFEGFGSKIIAVRLEDANPAASRAAPAATGTPSPS
ncbi:MAG: hypothetical protein HY264_02505 [Chloroflexi bacterium]|nr:hypothetical protein [Chloroflexota bacterium]